jgi:hypothetical protein
VRQYGRDVFIYRVDIGGGERDVVSILEPSWVFERGLSPEAILGRIGPGDSIDAFTPAGFQENPAFLRLLSRVIYEEVGNDPGLQTEAERQGEGSVYLLDGRTPDPAGRVPPEDIIGAVDVENGIMAPGSYQHNPRHRLLTVHGFFRLPSTLEAALDARLRSSAQA